MANILDLPDEIIILIFKFYVGTEGLKNLLQCIRKVCQKWSYLCLDYNLWLKVDGSLSERDFKKLCKAGQMRQTQELICSNFKCVRNANSVTEIFKCLPNLRVIDFSKVEYLNQHWMACLGKYCINLKEVKMSKKLRFAKYVISDRLMEMFLTLRGGNLVLLDLSNSSIFSMRKLLCLIGNFCANLEQLLMQNVMCNANTSFPLEAIQKGCPKLQVLRLGSPILLTVRNKKDISGFPALKIFTHCSYDDVLFSDLELMHVLSRSPDLRVLDIRGCVKLTVDGILSLPATHLENLYMSFTKILTSERLSEVLLKWSESLIVVELSRMKSRFLDDVLVNVVSMGGLPNLESLDLNNTNVSVPTILKIIANCKKLCKLDLTSCRGMGRGRQRKHFNKHAIERLFEELNDVHY